MAANIARKSGGRRSRASPGPTGDHCALRGPPTGQRPPAGSRGRGPAPPSATIPPALPTTAILPSAGIIPASQSRELGPVAPALARRALSRPKGSSQLVIASHFLAADPLQPHRHLAIKGIPVHIAFHRGGLTLAMPLHNQVILGDTRVGQHSSHRLRTSP